MEIEYENKKRVTRRFTLSWLSNFWDNYDRYKDDRSCSIDVIKTRELQMIKYIEILHNEIDKLMQINEPETV